MKKELLRSKIKKIASGPGIYIFRDSASKNLYIGKASNLKNRLKNYLTSNDIRIAKMLEEAKELKTTKTQSDIEALILEAQLIKKHRPPFNITMRDDKQYFYVSFSDEQFPQIIVNHRPTGQDPIGPFTDGGALKSTLRHLRKTFPFCTCKKPHHNFCLNYHIGKCYGFCCLKNIGASKEEKSKYLNNIKAIKNILSGKRNLVISDLKKSMRHMAEKEIFEEAIKLQKKIDDIIRIFENARIISSSAILNKSKDEIFSKNLPALKEMAKYFGLKHSPYRIEGYDISNIQGTKAVGVMIVFINGRPEPNQYRKFKIKTVKGADDTGMLREVLTRRFAHPEWLFPDLVIIDGGLAQFNTARKIVPAKIPIVSLAKDEKHRGSKIYIKSDKIISLKKLPRSVRNLILATDGEAHRFAINFYRYLHRTGILSSN